MTNPDSMEQSEGNLVSIGWEKLSRKNPLVKMLRSLSIEHPMACLHLDETSPLSRRLVHLHDQWQAAGEPDPETLLASYNPSPLERLCSYFDSVILTPNDQGHLPAPGDKVDAKGPTE